MTEILFYHLKKRGLYFVLPILLKKTLERGSKAVVKASEKERVESLNASLWTGEETIFTPHGSCDDPFPEKQPIYLTTGDENPAGADILFLIDGAEPPASLEGLTRAVYLFNDQDTALKDRARAAYADYKKNGFAVTYHADI